MNIHQEAPDRSPCLAMVLRYKLYTTDIMRQREASAASRLRWLLKSSIFERREKAEDTKCKPYMTSHKAPTPALRLSRRQAQGQDNRTLFLNHPQAYLVIMNPLSTINSTSPRYLSHPRIYLFQNIYSCQPLSNIPTSRNLASLNTFTHPTDSP